MKGNDHKKTTNLLLDLFLLSVLLLSLEQHATGIVVHEWLGIAIAFILMIHILLHWKWITCVISNFFTEKTKGQRLKFILGLLIFACFSTIIFTGIMMSRSALPALGIRTTEAPFWRWLHFFSVDLAIWLVAVHFALNWPWIVKTTKNLMSSFRFNLNLRRPDILTPLPAIASAKEGTFTPTSLSSRIKNTLNISLKVFAILIASATISLTWYGLSSTSFAKTRDTRHAHEHFNDQNGAGPGSGKHGFHRGRNIRVSELTDSMDSHRFGSIHHDENFSLIHALPGMVGHLLIISAVTGVTVMFKRKKRSA